MENKISNKLKSQKILKSNNHQANKANFEINVRNN